MHFIIVSCIVSSKPLQLVQREFGLYFIYVYYRLNNCPGVTSVAKKNPGHDARVYGFWFAYTIIITGCVYIMAKEATWQSMCAGAGLCAVRNIQCTMYDPD